MTEDARKILEETQTVYEEVQDYLRPAAEFFHENEGELFTRSEAADELVEELDISERIANNTLAQLVGDTVDPVVQVGRAGEQYVGVADFREFDGAYGYLEYDDVIGPRKRVVCQQCVNGATSDKQVTHATEKSQDPSASTFEQEADYDELLGKIHEHYGKVHDVEPTNVETGATLVSGTTIGGNTAWHDGNVTGGTGITIGATSVSSPDVLSAETLYQTGEPTLADAGYVGSTYDGPTDIKNNITGHIQGMGSVIDSFDAQSISTFGLSVDPADGTLWYCEGGNDIIYHLNRDGTIINQFDAQSTGAYGIGVDPSDGTLWYVENDNQTIYHLNQDGTVITSFDSPNANPSGLGVDPSDGTLWHSDFDAELIYHLNQDGTVINSFAAQDTLPFGLSVDPADGTLWHSGNGSATIYHLNRDGTVIDSFDAKDNRPTGISVDPADGTVWYAENGNDKIYHLSSVANTWLTTIGGSDYALARRSGV